MDADRGSMLRAAGHTIVLSFAGHGLVDASGRLRLALASTSLQSLGATALAFDEVAGLLKRSKARVVVLLDVCHSGLSDQVRVAANDHVVGQLVTDSGASMVVLSASKGRQFSLENPSVNGGLFSVAIADALSKDRAKHDIDGDGALSLEELYLAVKAYVVRASGGQQTPWLSRNLVFGRFATFSDGKAARGAHAQGRHIVSYLPDCSHPDDPGEPRT